MSESEEKTRVTTVLPADKKPEQANRGDCLVTIYAKDSASLGKRYVLESSPTMIGRGHDNHIVMDSDSVSRRHCRIERKGPNWYMIDDGSTNGTYVNDDQLSEPMKLQSGDRIKIGPTIFKYLSGSDVESQYHEEIYQITIIDGLTQAHNKRHLVEQLEKEITRARRYLRDLSCIMFDVDHFKKVNDVHGHLAGDYVLKELARVVRLRLRGEETFARYGGEEFCILMPETPVVGAKTLAEDIRKRVEASRFVFQGESIPCTISCGVACLSSDDRDGLSLIKRADQCLYDAKRQGRNRVILAS